MFDLGIVNGFAYIDGKLEKVNIYIDGEKIRKITEEKMECKELIDVRGLNIFPGFIDPHVHFSLGVGKNKSKDDFKSGSIEAALGGITTYIDFLDPVRKATDIGHEFEKRSDLAKESIIDYSFHGTIADPVDSPEMIIKEIKSYGINSIKLFTTYSDTKRRTYDNYIYKLLKESKEENVVILVHAENEELLKLDKDILIKEHEKSRPVVAETTEVTKLSEMARETGGKLYIVHVSAGSTVQILAEKFENELAREQIILESCPHYFLLNSDSLIKDDGYKYTMTPPIREESERQLLIDNAHLIKTIGTDHCPFTKEQKNHKYTSEVPMGIGGLKYSFLNLYQEFGLSIVNKFTEAPARIYGLKHKGKLEIDYDADITIVDFNNDTYIEDEMSVYSGKKLKGKIEKVYSRGKLIVNRGVVIDNNGNYLRRGK